MSPRDNPSLSDFEAARSAGRPILLTGGAVVTMDPQVPADLERMMSDVHGANDGLVTLRLAALSTEEIAGPAMGDADARNIHTVLVAGNPRKWAGALVGEEVDALRADVIRSRDDITRRVVAR